jgi:hypothetical protein
MHMTKLQERIISGNMCLGKVNVPISQN